MVWTLSEPTFASTVSNGPVTPEFVSGTDWWLLCLRRRSQRGRVVEEPNSLTSVSAWTCGWGTLFLDVGFSVDVWLGNPVHA